MEKLTPRATKQKDSDNADQHLQPLTYKNPEIIVVKTYWIGLVLQVDASFGKLAK